MYFVDVHRFLLTFMGGRNEQAEIVRRRSMRETSQTEETFGFSQNSSLKTSQRNDLMKNTAGITKETSIDDEEFMGFEAT
eukprot:m.3286 g.3286  ORF g.3286 m.3286 type:complete len:80 (+) comp2148_c0_seq2:285-524(+)